MRPSIELITLPSIMASLLGANPRAYDVFFLQFGALGMRACRCKVLCSHPGDALRIARETHKDGRSFRIGDGLRDTFEPETPQRAPSMG